MGATEHPEPVAAALSDMPWASGGRQGRCGGMAQDGELLRARDRRQADPVCRATGMAETAGTRAGEAPGNHALFVTKPDVVTDAIGQAARAPRLAPSRTDIEPENETLDMPTLYFHPQACSMASHVALEEAGISYETKAVNIFKGEQFTPEYKAINPRSKVPALRLDDGQVLLESTAILAWIGDAFPERGLLGVTAIERAQTIAACAWLAGTVHPTFKEYFHPENVVDDAGMRSAVKAKAKSNYWAHLQELDRLMEDRSWMVGTGFTLADPYALVFFSWGRDLKLPIEDLRNMMRLKDNLIARPAARRVLEKENSVLLKI